jgi:hypothetical protein
MVLVDVCSVLVITGVFKFLLMCILPTHAPKPGLYNCVLYGLAGSCMIFLD